MSNIVYKNTLGAIYYLNLLYDTAPSEIKDEIEQTCSYIQNEIDDYTVSKNNKNLLSYDPKVLTESELIRETILTLNNVTTLYKINVKNLINYVRKISIREKGERRKC